MTLPEVCPPSVSAEKARVKKVRLTRLALAAALVLFATLNASAAVLGTYTSRASWKTASGGSAPNFIVLDFETITAGDYSATGLVDVATSGVSFYGSNTNIGYLMVDDTSCTSGCGSLNGKIVRQSTSMKPADINITLPPTVRGFGMDWMGFGSPVAGFTITFSDGSSHSYEGLQPSTNPSNSFWGVETDLSITSLSIRNPFGIGGVISLDNFEIYTPDEAPPPSEVAEVSSLLLLGSGLISLPLLRRRRAIPAARA